MYSAVAKSSVQLVAQGLILTSVKELVWINQIKWSWWKCCISIFCFVFSSSKMLQLKRKLTIQLFFFFIQRTANNGRHRGRENKQKGEQEKKSRGLLTSKNLVLLAGMTPPHLTPEIKQLGGNRTKPMIDEMMFHSLDCAWGWDSLGADTHHTPSHQYLITTALTSGDRLWEVEKRVTDAHTSAKRQSRLL